MFNYPFHNLSKKELILVPLGGGICYGQSQLLLQDFNNEIVGKTKLKERTAVFRFYVC